MLSDDAAPSQAAAILVGRYMLPNREEFRCQVGELNVYGATFLSSGAGEIGDYLISYIDEIGRLEARIVDKLPEGFRVEFVLSDTQREKIAARIRRLVERDRLGSHERRRHPRLFPKDGKSSLMLPDGRVYPCEVVNISVSGAAIKTMATLGIGTYVMLGKTRARVVRLLWFGFAIEFVKVLDSKSLDDHIGFRF